MKKVTRYNAFVILWSILVASNVVADEIDDLRVELSLWKAVKDSQDARLYEHYLDSYPNGYFAEVAEYLIEKTVKPAASSSELSLMERTAPDGALRPWLGIAPATVQIERITNLGGETFTSAAEALWEQVATISETSISLDPNDKTADIVISGRVIGLEEKRQVGAAATIAKTTTAVGRLFRNRSLDTITQGARTVDDLDGAEGSVYTAKVVLIAQNRHTRQELNATASSEGLNRNEAVRNATKLAFVDLRERLVTVPALP